VDSSTWQALGLTLTVVGLLLSAVVWKRRGPASGLRGVAWSLLPLAAGLTGTLRLAGDIARAVGHWATRLVFSPVVWSGVVLAGISVVLFVVSGTMRSRGIGTRGRKPAAGLPAERSSKPASTPGSRAKAGGGRPAVQDEDMDDIEAILRKHGIQ
jgi:hypothetical protein